jgi:hypothetical protein
MTDVINIDSGLILQAAKMLRDETIEHPIAVSIVFDAEAEEIQLIDETTGKMYYCKIFGEE